MKYEKMAQALNKSRVSRGEPAIPLTDLIDRLKKSEKDIVMNNLDDDQQKALKKFRELEQNKELEKSIRETPLIIKIIWAAIFMVVFTYIGKWIFS